VRVRPWCSNELTGGTAGARCAGSAGTCASRMVVEMGGLNFLLEENIFPRHSRSRKIHRKERG